jgi:hypothetical protein
VVYLFAASFVCGFGDTLRGAEGGERPFDSRTVDAGLVIVT